MLLQLKPQLSSPWRHTRAQHVACRSNAAGPFREWEPAAAAEPASAPDTDEQVAGVGAFQEWQPVTNTPEPEVDIQALLQKAEEAAAQAQNGLSTIHLLPSATPPNPMVVALRKAALPVAALIIVAAACTSTALGYSPGMGQRITGSALAGLALALGGLYKRALDVSGAVAACAVGLGTFASSFCATTVVLAFFLSSSALTRVAGARKAKMDAEFKEGGQRDWQQVACNGAVPTLLAIAAAYYTGCVDLPLGSLVSGNNRGLVTALQGAFLGYYSCCCGDTWASEIGVLSKATPRLITTMRPVRAGTNGAVSLLGLAASAGGGLLMGLVYFAVSHLAPQTAAASALVGGKQWMLIPFGAVGGLLGSLIDSVLGATVQFSGFDTKLQKVVNHDGEGILRISGHSILSNNLVNLCAASSTAALMGLAATQLFC